MARYRRPGLRRRRIKVYLFAATLLVVILSLSAVIAAIVLRGSSDVEAPTTLAPTEEPSPEPSPEPTHSPEPTPTPEPTVDISVRDTLPPNKYGVPMPASLGEGYLPIF